MRQEGRWPRSDSYRSRVWRGKWRVLPAYRSRLSKRQFNQYLERVDPKQI